MQPLVTTDWLAQHLDDPSLRIIDIRGYVLPATEPPPHYFNQHEDYLDRHIPNAIFVDWTREITNPDSPYHAQVASAERFAAVMSRAGVDADTHVIAYDTNNGMFAARLWWMLNYYGHEHVSVLDGGWDKWVREGRPTTAEIPKITPSEFVPRPNPALIRYADDVAQTAKSDTVLVDVRSPKEFAGEASRTALFGHIDGATNLPRKSLINADGTLRELADLRTTFEAIGIDTDTSEVVTYCNSGVSASYVMLALRAAGIENVALYDGSWKDWSHRHTEND
jgi:thiosulfate/3-mercaptopyruvate sulfurtransferase